MDLEQFDRRERIEGKKATGGKGNWKGTSSNKPNRAVKFLTLKVALLLGGQRAAQLLRLRRADVDLQSGTLRLYEGKGRRRKPRVHELPLTAEVTAILRPMMERAQALDCDWIFTSHGDVPIVPDTLSTAGDEIAKEMVKAGESRVLFILSDIRRTVETLLAGRGHIA